MNEYLKAQNKTNDAVIANAFSSDELDRFSKSDIAGQITDPNNLDIELSKKEKYTSSSLARTSNRKCPMNTGACDWGKKEIALCTSYLLL